MRHAGSHDKGNGRSFAFVAQRTWSAATAQTPGPEKNPESGSAGRRRRGASSAIEGTFDKDDVDNLCARVKRRNTPGGIEGENVVQMRQISRRLGALQTKGRAPSAKGQIRVTGTYSGPRPSARLEDRAVLAARRSSFVGLRRSHARTRPKSARQTTRAPRACIERPGGSR